MVSEALPSYFLHDDTCNYIFHLIGDRNLRSQSIFFHPDLEFTATHDDRFTARGTQGLHRAPAHRHAHTQADCLGKGFLGCETRRQTTYAARFEPGFAAEIFKHFFRAEDFFSPTVAAALQHCLQARNPQNVDTDAVNHIQIFPAASRRALSMIAFMSLTALRQPTKMACA